MERKKIAIIAGIAAAAGLLLVALKGMKAIPIKIPEKKEVAVEIEKIEII